MKKKLLKVFRGMIRSMNEKKLKLLLLFVFGFIPIITYAEENNFKVGDNVYASIDEAVIEATNSKKELLFLKDIELKKITVKENQDVILNLNGYNLNCDASDLVPICIVNDGKLQIKGENSIITASNEFIRNREGANLVIESGTFNLGTETSIAMPAITNASTLIINGGVFNIKKYLYGIQSGSSNGTNTTITNGVFNFEDINDLIYFSNKGKLTISGGNFNGDGTFVNTTLNLSNISESFNEVSILGGNFDYVKNEKSTTSMFVFNGSTTHNNTLINISNINIIDEKIKIISAYWVNLSIINSTLISDEIVVSTTGGILTIGSNDNNIENIPIITSKSKFAISATDTINFYDGLITSTTSTPLSGDLNTLPSYNVIDNNNGTYTARLTNETYDKNVDEETNEEVEVEDKDSNNEKEINNPKTGSGSIYLFSIVLIITIFIIYFCINKKHNIFNTK